MSEREAESDAYRVIGPVSWEGGGGGVDWLARACSYTLEWNIPIFSAIVPCSIPQPGKKFYFRARNTFPDSGKEKSIMGNAKIIPDSDTGFSRIRTGRFRRNPRNQLPFFTV